MEPFVLGRKAGQIVIRSEARNAWFASLPKCISHDDTFHLDMTDAEKEVIQHVAYWTETGKEGVAVVCGPVLDPKGVYGIGIYRVDDLAHMRRFLADDPAREILKYEVFEMPRAVVGSPSSSSG